MELTTTNIKKMLKKEAMIRWLAAQPEEKRFAPDSPCACMYHDMLSEAFNVAYVHPTYADIEIGFYHTVRINGNSFAQKFQKAAAHFAFQQHLKGIDEDAPRMQGCRTISRDDALAIAKGIK